MKAVVNACHANDEGTLIAIFGADHEELVRTGDVAADRENRVEFARRVDEMVKFEKIDDDRIEVVVGKNEWPSPIPLVCEDGKWRFDTASGIEEILNRRVGRNELAAIALCNGYLDAQHIYQSRDWDNDGHREYAQRIKSNPGKFDGLYWPTDDPTKVPLCPVHEFIGANQDYFEHREAGSPWRGYYVRVLTSQGDKAKGGAMDYVVDGHMTKGFALVAWPAEYDRTGVMTFLVSHHGFIYQKDLGKDTVRLAAAIDRFDPDESWSEVDE